MWGNPPLLPEFTGFLSMAALRSHRSRPKTCPITPNPRSQMTVVDTVRLALHRRFRPKLVDSWLVSRQVPGFVVFFGKDSHLDGYLCALFFTLFSLVDEPSTIEIWRTTSFRWCFSVQCACIGSTRGNRRLRSTWTAYPFSPRLGGDGP